VKTNCRRKSLKFHGFITAAHDASDGQLAERHVEPTMPLPPARNAVRTAWRELGVLVRIIMKVRAAIASRVPVGYEDESGFHYNANAGDRLSLFFTDNSTL
jgi:hypothetical protein